MLRHQEHVWQDHVWIATFLEAGNDGFKTLWDLARAHNPGALGGVPLVRMGDPSRWAVAGSGRKASSRGRGPSDRPG